MSKVLGYTLLPHQKEHVQTIVDTLSRNKSVLDLSLMGRGKTFTTCYTACVLKCVMVIICPASVETKWREMKTKFNAPVWKVISYESLRGKCGKQPKHGLLKRKDKTTNNGSVVTFSPTDDLVDATKLRNVLFVFDEVQKTKNNSAQSKACISMVNYAYKTKNSKVILLSGTPIDKKEQSINILKMMGLITSSMLVRRDNESGLIKWYGFKKLYSVCCKEDKQKTLEIEDKYNKNKTSDYPKFSYDLFIGIVLDKLSSKMPNVLESMSLNIRNRFFKCTESEKIKLKGFIGKMKFYTESLMSEGSENKINIISNIQKCLSNIEETKIPILSRNAQMVLSTGKKVCIMVNFTNTVDVLKEKLSLYEPIVIDGRTPKNKRQQLLEVFQEDSNDNMLVIANMDVLSTGVDMDDKFGNRERYVFASPNYKTMVIQQMTYRFLRSDTKSNTNIDFVYGDCGIEESSILGCLSKKSCVMRDSCRDNGNNKVTYPDEYTKLIG